jgi:hypothetical protein
MAKENKLAKEISTPIIAHWVNECFSYQPYIFFAPAYHQNIYKYYLSEK